MPQPVLVLVRDLLFSSKISSTAQSLNLPVRLIRDPTTLADQPGDRLIVDLNQAGALESAIGWKALGAGRRVVGFVSHVDQATIDRAKSGNIDQILPRSQFVLRLNELLK